MAGFLVLALGMLIIEPGAAESSGAQLGDAQELCPSEMQVVENAFCIDRFEATTAEINSDGQAIAHSPFQTVEGLRVRAISHQGVVPQAYVSRNQAEAACREAQKRLCTDREWVSACKGPSKNIYPYGNAHKPGYCVDTNRVSPLTLLFGSLGSARFRFSVMNDPALNQVPGSIALTGSSAHCTNEYGVYDMVGNLHEWTADPQGTFRGGFYLDTQLNGSGCDYKTVAHPATYHDYSTGFRCCKGVAVKTR